MSEYYDIRKLTKTDDIWYLLKELNKEVGSCCGDGWEHFWLHYRYNHNLTIYVLEVPGIGGFPEIVGCATLLIEPKMIHNFGKVGHIEDVVIDPDQQGKGYGKVLIKLLTEKAKKRGCYKVILDCDESKVPFYEKCGMKKKSIGMALYF